MGRANARNRKPNEMKPRAMPASVERRAARGVALRTRSATNAAASSMIPEHGDEARLPRDARRVRGACGRRERLGGKHDQEHVGDQRHGVDAVRQRADVGSSRAFGEPPRLEGVEHVPKENRDGSPRQHAAVHELGREAEHEPAKRVDEEQLNEVVERETEEPVDVAADEPGHGAYCRG
jgi:hypothetical protein